MTTRQPKQPQTPTLKEFRNRFKRTNQYPHNLTAYDRLRDATMTIVRTRDGWYRWDLRYGSGRRESSSNASAYGLEDEAITALYQHLYDND